MYVCPTKHVCVPTYVRLYAYPMYVECKNIKLKLIL